MTCGKGGGAVRFVRSIKVCFIGATLCLGCIFAQDTAKPTTADAKVAAPGAKPALNAENLVREWLKRLNALADWVPGKGGENPTQVVDKFAELYDPTALQLTGPNENQIGTVIYSGLEGVRHWADWFARTYSHSEYRIQEHTEQVKTAALFYTAEPPWGGLDVSVELGAFYTARESKKKFAAPGAAFFDYTPQGKIKFLRLFMQKDETIEIFP